MSRIVEVLQRVEQKRKEARKALTDRQDALPRAAAPVEAYPTPAPKEAGEPQPVVPHKPSPRLTAIEGYAPRSEEAAARLIPIASGKGGVGKTNLSVNLAVALARRPERPSVVLMDADFGLPNADILLGASAGPTLDDFARRKTNDLAAVARPTAVEGLRFLSGAENPSMTLAHLQYQKRRMFQRHIRTLAADFVLLDLGASVHFEVLDFFSMVNRGVVVTNPEPTARRDALLFIKAALLRRIKTETRSIPRLSQGVEEIEEGLLPNPRRLLHRLDRLGAALEAKTLRQILARFRPLVVVNRVETESEGAKTFERIQADLDGWEIKPGLLGFVPDDPLVVRSVKEEAPLLLSYPNAPAAAAITRIANALHDDKEMTLERNYFSFTDYIRRVFGGRG